VKEKSTGTKIVPVDFEILSFGRGCTHYEKNVSKSSKFYVGLGIGGLHATADYSVCCAGV